MLVDAMFRHVEGTKWGLVRYLKMGYFVKEYQEVDGVAAG